LVIDEEKKKDNAETPSAQSKKEEFKEKKNQD